GKSDEPEAVLRIAQRQHAGARIGGTLPLEPRRQLLPLFTEDADRQRNDHRQLVSLPRRRWDFLLHDEIESLGMLVPTLLDADFRSARLRIPETEVTEVDAASIFHRLDEIVARHGLPVMPFEVEIHAGPEFLRADHGMDHADDFGAFLVDGWRVEVVDRDVAVGPNRMRRGAGIFRKLRRAQPPHVGDAFYR